MTPENKVKRLLASEMPEDVSLLGNVLIRSDLNVPISNGNVIDNFRIKKSIEYIEDLLNISTTITFTSHLGRPVGFENSLARGNEFKQTRMARNRKSPTEIGVVTFFIF